MGRAHICAWGADFCQLAKDVNLICQTVGVPFFFFCQKNKDAKALWLTVGVAHLKFAISDLSIEHTSFYSSNHGRALEGCLMF
jgi:hypothetical protein